MFFNKFSLAILVIGIALAPLMPAYAAPVPHDVRMDALAYVEHQLVLDEQDSAAADFLLRLKDEIESNDVTLTLVYDFASAYQHQREKAAEAENVDVIGNIIAESERRKVSRNEFDRAFAELAK